MHDLYRPSSQVEAEAIAAFLEQNGIESETVGSDDGAYAPAPRSQFGWGVLRVSEQDVEAASTLLAEWLGSETENHSGSGNVTPPCGAGGAKRYRKP